MIGVRLARASRGRSRFKHWRDTEREFKHSRDKRMKVSLAKVEICCEKDKSQGEDPSGRSET